MTMITISNKEYFELRLAQVVLDRLEREGVDNWQGYSYPLEEEERLRADILGDEDDE